MVTVTFILNTGADTLASWLKATWRPISRGRIQLQGLGDNNGRHGASRRLAADGILVLERKGQDSAEAHRLETVVLFELLPLSEERVEVRAGCRYHADFLPWFADLLSEMVKRWPEMRDTLDMTSVEFAENDTQEQAMEAFARRIQHLKIKPGQRAAMYDRSPARIETDINLGFGGLIDIYQEKLQRDLRDKVLGDPDEAQHTEPLEVTESAHLASATFYLDSNPANFKTWLVGRWRRKHAVDIFEPGKRVIKLEPMAESTDSGGRSLLIVAASYIGAGNQVIGSNERCLEFLVTPLSSDRIEVIAGCSELAWVGRLARLLMDVKTAYRDKMYVISYLCSWGLLEDPQDEDREFFGQVMDEFRETIALIDPRFEPFAPAEDAPDTVTAPAEPTRDDGPPGAELDPDSIPRWGRRRDLTTWEVKDIVRRCKQYQAANGSIPKFHEQESRHWPDPDDSPKSYSAKTLESWMTQKRFQ